MNQEDYKIAYENVLEANKMLNKTINELRESVINWDIDYYGLTSDEDKQRLHELKDILEIKEDSEIDKLNWYINDMKYATGDPDIEAIIRIILDIQDKINEIIDHINGSEKE